MKIASRMTNVLKGINVCLGNVGDGKELFVVQILNVMLIRRIMNISSDVSRDMI